MEKNQIFLKNNIKHIGIIMDGNGRWAKKRFLPRNIGHEKGGKVFKDIADFCSGVGLKSLTVYAFSTENWSRPQKEVDGLMKILRNYFVELLSDKESFIKKNTRILIIGDITKLDIDIRENAKELMRETKKLTGMTLNIAINYGGRAEILRAFKNIYKEILKDELEIEKIDEATLSSYMYTKNQDDLDFIIRTGGDFRVSNFLIWQSAYSEYLVTDTLWPDFTKKELLSMAEDFTKRERRFGGVNAPDLI